MLYFYVFPFNKQYYFPADFREYPFLLSFYTPYTLVGNIFWRIWRKWFLLKYFFYVKESRVPNLAIIKDLVGKESIIALNTGTKGPEQKTSGIGIYLNSKQRFFIKAAASDKGKNLISNEYFILKKLWGMPGIPQIIKFQTLDSWILLQTSFLDGEKFQQTLLTGEIYNLLLDLSKISTEGCQDFSQGFAGKKCFAHGDFCPWNIMICDSSLYLVDWEMAGIYQAGFDLFTYIFQTQFILHPKKKTTEIFKQNLSFMQSYFVHIGVTDWDILLFEFGANKFNNTVNKSPILARRFREILDIKL